MTISRCLLVCAVSACQLYDKSVGTVTPEPDAAAVVTPPDAPSPPLPHVLGSTRWAVIIGNTTTFNDGMSIAIDPDDNVILGGDLGEPDHGTGGSGFVSKLAGGDGGAVWTRGWATEAAYANVWSVAADGSGNVYVTGGFGATSGSAAVTVDFGGQSLAANKGAFLLKLTSDGALVWARGAPTTAFSGYGGVAVGSAGQVYVCGGFRYGTITFPNGAFTNPTMNAPDVSNNATFLAAYAADGTLQWGQPLLPFTNQNIQLSGLAAAPNGDAMITGTFSDTMGFGGAPLVANGDSAAYFAEFSSTGILAAQSVVGSDESLSFGAVRGDGTFVIDAIPDSSLVTTGLPSVIALDATGGTIWNTGAQGSGNPGPIATTATGATVIGGNTGYDGPTLNYGGESIQAGTFIAAFDASGQFVESRTYDTASIGNTVDNPSAIEAIASNNNTIAFTTPVDQPVDFGTGVLAAGGMGSGSSSIWTTDIAVVMLNAP